MIHLGDYIYEYEAKGERASDPPNEIFSLYDYRTRHGQYRTDKDLQLLAQNHAWITTWDDHEFANNGYRDGFSGLNNTEESFLNDGPKVSVDTRKVHATRAYFEWMPIRQTDLDDGLRVWRSFQMGKLLDLVILDTRNYDRSITSLGWNDKYIDLIRDDPSRTLMGSRQENWFYDALSESQERGATWKIVGNQIIFSRIFENDDGKLSGDNWNVSILLSANTCVQTVLTVIPRATSRTATGPLSISTTTRSGTVSSSPATATRTGCLTWLGWAPRTTTRTLERAPLVLSSPVPPLAQVVRLDPLNPKPVITLAA